MLTVVAATMQDPKLKHAELLPTRESSLLMRAQQPVVRSPGCSRERQQRLAIAARPRPAVLPLHRRTSLCHRCRNEIPSVTLA
jgi:hypothetical protein